MGLKTSDIRTGGQSKTIVPGQQTLRINSVNLKRFSFMEDDEGYFLILDLESKPLEGFEGFFIDPDNEELGRYEGQVGQVKTDRYYYKDSTYGKRVIKRDDEILKEIKRLCMCCGAKGLKWFDDANDVYDTIEEFVQAFNEAAPYKGLWFEFIIAGKEYPKKEGSFVGIDLFLPKFKMGRVLYQPEGTTPSLLLEYDPEEHLIKLDPEDTIQDNDDDVAGDPNLVKGAPTFRNI